jgi:hypothetical protein
MGGYGREREPEVVHELEIPRGAATKHPIKDIKASRARAPSYHCVYHGAYRYNGRGAPASPRRIEIEAEGAGGGKHRAFSLFLLLLLIIMLFVEREAKLNT